jgi:hypothetical protein
MKEYIKRFVGDKEIIFKITETQIHALKAKLILDLR